MPSGSHYSLIGSLVATSRGFALDLDDGGRLRLDVLDTTAATWLVGKRVTAAGAQSEFGLLDVKMLALAD